MNSMKVYHVSLEPLPSLQLFPRVPNNAMDLGNEDDRTKRICVCPTIPGCIMSAELICRLAENNTETATVYVYSADVPFIYLKQPSVDEVPDAWSTGEMWVMVPWTFQLDGVYNLHKGLSHAISPAYTRWIMTRVGHDIDIVDIIGVPPIYGSLDSFSFIELDINRARKYVSKIPDLDTADRDPEEL